MAFRKKYEEVPQNPYANSFASKYSLANAAGMKEKGNKCFVIPLDMANGFVSLPCHTVKPVGESGFKGGKFATKIICHKYDMNTGEVVDNEPLCCKLAKLEKVRKPEQNDSILRALTAQSWRNVIPVLVLASSEESSDKGPTLKKVSLKGVSFSFLEMADMTYEESIVSAIKKEFETSSTIDIDDATDEEIRAAIAKYLATSVIMISNEETKKAVKYERSYKVIPSTAEAVAATSGEHKEIEMLCNLLAGRVDASKLDALYAKYPVLKEINNQVVDYISLFNAEVDTLVSDWVDSELQEHYNKYVEAQTQVDQYKDVNTVAQANAQQAQTVQFTQPARQAAPATATAVMEAPAATAVEEDYDYSTTDIESTSIVDDEDFADEFAMSDDDEFLVGD